MTIDDILFFDTETTGLPQREWSWDKDYEMYPHIVQIAWMHQGHIESHIIRPDGWEIPEEASAIHGITTDRALAEGEPFAYVVDMFIQDCHDSGLICGHNIYFDTSILKANILRELGQEYYDAADVEGALYKGKRIDTMRPSMKWVDARTASGRLKFPTLSELYSRCFPGNTFPAHNAAEDVKALAQCLPFLVENGLVELKVREYYEEQLEDAAKVAADKARKIAEAQPVPESAEKGPISDAKTENDKLPIPTVKVPEIKNSGEIRESMADLLDQNDF